MVDQKSKIKNQRSGNNTSGSSAMARLLSSAKTSIVTFKKGENVNGIVTKLTPREILIDINAKTEAVVLEKDKKILKRLLSQLKEGDKVEVTILNTESEMGYPVVSLRRFIDNLTFKNLEELKKEKKPVSVFIENRTSGGFLVLTDDGMQGFLPNSQISSIENAQTLIGKKIDAIVWEIDRPTKKIIFSKKAMQGSGEFDDSVKSLKVDQKISATVSSIVPFGLFVTLQTTDGKQIEGLVHISEISWEKVTNLDELYSVGQKIEMVVIGFDKDSKRVDLSIKRLTNDPFEEKAKNFSVDQKITGKVTQVLDSGVVLELHPSARASTELSRMSSGQAVEGFIRKEKIPPTVTYSVGDSVTGTVFQIDKKRRRIVLIPVLLEKPIGYR
ncbi:MAG: S1 RNA-binding domain-containing protein [Patescibacteria group bacterium]|nr:S1 RNA-binding domain-containing protein [Patescibacteria group bacterium]